MNRELSSLPKELRCELHRVQEAECQRLLSAYNVPATVAYSVFCILGLREVKLEVTQLACGQAQGPVASAPTLAELRHVVPGQAQGEGLVGRPWAGSCMYSEARKSSHGPQPQFTGTSSKAKCMCQEEQAQLGLPSRFLFPLSFYAVGI